jgi:acetyltransferase-like isoleucine patch superfamily enzyme
MKQRILFHIFKWFRPFMVAGFRNAKGQKIQGTRISNTTYIQNPEKLHLENNVFIGHHNFIDASNGLTIGEGCQITNFTSILTHSSHISIRLYGKEYSRFNDHIGYVKAPVHIGSYSFIGPHSVIMPGTQIGIGSIVSAFSYVNGQFPAFAVIAGQPAKVIGDTRTLDREFLDKYPELEAFYKAWTDDQRLNPQKEE